MTASGHLADQLRRIGRLEGLDSVGICDARPFTEERAILEERKRIGWSDEMQFTYRNPARSTDPSVALPGAQALFVGARRYLRAEPEETGGGVAARVARYSWVDHYEPLRRGLDAVALRLREDGWRALVLCDDNALVDRAAAARAGLGWYGKNANVLIPGAGSWFVLGSVVTDAPLCAGMAPVPAVADGCGTCHRCISACPTGALVGPGQLDARRCLAWLVQRPGVFPVEFRRALGNRIYGCDDCQDVCPINKRADGPEKPPIAEAGAQAYLDVIELLEADDATLEGLVGRWYIPGRQFRYVRRNALIVLGNTADPGDPAVEAILRRCLADEDSIVRSHAAWAAAALGRHDLLRSLAGDRDPLVRAELDKAAP